MTRRQFHVSLSSRQVRSGGHQARWPDPGHRQQQGQGSGTSQEVVDIRATSVLGMGNRLVSVANRVGLCSGSEIF